MRVGINATYLLPGRVGGTEIYLRQLLAAMPEVAAPEDRFELLVNRESEDAGILPADSRFVQRATGVTASVRPARLLWEQLMLPGFARRAGYDVLFHPGFTAPWYGPVPSVVTFHDLQFRDHPEFFRPLDRLAWRLVLDPVAQRAARVICISEATRRSFCRYYPASTARAVRVYSGVDREFRRRPWQPDRQRPYLLAVSTLHPHKNLPRLIQAFAALRADRPELRLVLAGMRGFATNEVLQVIEATGQADVIEVPGWLPRQDLYALYAGAHAFVFPSLYEGFGLPVIEALAMGIPTACSALPVLDELAGEAAQRFDPHDTAALAGALRAVVLDEKTRARLHHAGPLQAAPFDWRTAAAATLAVLREAACSRMPSAGG